VIQSDILVADVLEHVAGQLLEFVALCVDKVAEIASGAACWTVEVFARNGPVVARLD